MSKKSKSTSGPSKFAQPYINSAVGAVTNAYNDNAGNVAQLSDVLSSNLPGVVSNAFSNPGLAAASSYATDTLAGKYLGGENAGSDYTASVLAGRYMPAGGSAAADYSGGYLSDVASGKYRVDTRGLAGGGYLADAAGGAYLGAGRDTTAAMTDTQAAGDRLSLDVLGGRYLNNNPTLQGVIDSTNGSVMDRVNGALGARGLAGGSAQAGILARELAKNESGLRYSDYSNERAIQQATAGQAAASRESALARNFTAGQSERDRQQSAAGLTSAQALQAALSERGYLDSAASTATGQRFASAQSERAAQEAAAGRAQAGYQAERGLQQQSAGTAATLASAGNQNIAQLLQYLTAGATLPTVGADNYSAQIAALLGGYNTKTSTPSTMDFIAQMSKNAGQAIAGGG